MDWILGAYYAAEDNGIRFDIPIMNGTQQSTVGWQGSFISQRNGRLEGDLQRATWNQVTGAPPAAFATSDERKNIGGNGYGWNCSADPFRGTDRSGLDPTKPGSGFRRSRLQRGRFTGSQTTYLSRARYDVRKDFLTYASISTGYKSGGLQDGGSLRLGGAHQL